MLRERSLDLDGVTIHFVEGPPSGPPLVLLHGGGARWQSLWPIIPSLMTRWHILAPDLRGHGKSGRVPGQYRPEHYVADIRAFVEHQCAEPALLFGHSLGAWIALLAAAELTDKVQALILGDPPLCMERYLAVEGHEQRVGMWRALRGFAGLPVAELACKLADLPVPGTGRGTPLRHGDLPGMDAAHFRGWAKTLSQVDPDVAQYHAEGRMEEYVESMDLDAALQQVTCPVLLLQPDRSHGGFLSDDDVRHALSLLANGVHVRLVGAGHDLGLSGWKVDPLLRAMTDFLESL